MSNHWDERHHEVAIEEARRHQNEILNNLINLCPGGCGNTVQGNVLCSLCSAGVNNIIVDPVAAAGIAGAPGSPGYEPFATDYGGTGNEFTESSSVKPSPPPLEAEVPPYEIGSYPEPSIMPVTWTSISEATACIELRQAAENVRLPDSGTALSSFDNSRATVDLNRNSDNTNLHDFLTPCETIQPTTTPPPATKPDDVGPTPVEHMSPLEAIRTREELRQELSAHRLNLPADLPQFYCTDCQTHVVVPGRCPTCGLILKLTGELIDVYSAAFDPELHFVDPLYAVDTRYKSKGSKSKGGKLTALGYSRNSSRFWKALLHTNPELFSPRNRKRISSPHPRAPRVDKRWLEFHPGQEFYRGDDLVHHHWDQGPWAFGIPEHFHTFFHNLLHPL